MAGETMRQWEARPGQTPTFQLTSTARPTPGPGEALVRIDAVSLNYRDIAMLDGELAAPSGPPVPGSDIAGEVVAVGPLVTRVAVGDRVIDADNTDWIDGRPPQDANAVPVLGRLAEFAVIPAAQLVRAPASLEAAGASTLPVAGSTAWFALVEEGGLHAGQTIVVQGTGGVSLFALQLAHAHGARVIVTSSSDIKLKRALALGADHVINRVLEPEWQRTVLEITGGRGADHVLEMAGGDNLARSLEAVALGGRVSLIGLLDDAQMRAPIVPLLYKRATLAAIAVGHRRALEDLVRAVDNLSLKPQIDGLYDFSDVPKAFEHLRRGPFGKVVVSLASETSTSHAA